MREPVYYGSDADAALAFVRSFQTTAAALATLDVDAVSDVVRDLRSTLAAHHRGDQGVLFDARSWVITAYRADG